MLMTTSAAASKRVAQDGHVLMTSLNRVGSTKAMIAAP